MEKLPSVRALMWAIIAIFCFEFVAGTFEHVTKFEFQSDVSTMGSYLRATTMNINLEVQENSEEKEQELQEVLSIPMSIQIVPEIVYDGMTLEELGTKLNRSLKSTLSGYGKVFAQLSLDNGVDPYVAIAIVLHETGCYSGKCSTLTSQCNNVGGMKGSPGCGGPYKRFSTLDQGIQAFIENLSRGYYQKGLTTVEQIGKKYAESNTWATKVNNYIKIIKAN